MQRKTGDFLLPTLGAGIGAMILAAMMDMSFHEIVLAGFLGALLIQVWRLRRHVEDLGDEINELKARTRSATLIYESSQTIQRTAARNVDTASTLRDEFAASVTTTPNTVKEQPKPTSADLSDAAAVTGTVIYSPATAATPRPSGQSGTSKRIYVPPPPSAFELQLQAFWNWLKTRNPIALAAVAISFLGGVFLIKYAAEHAMFPIEYRFIGLGVVTIAAIIVGWRVHSRDANRAVFAQILQGGGIAGLYLTVFAATRLYQLLPAQLSFVLMVGIAFAAAILAVAQSALPLAVIGTVGGYLTPILVSTGQGSHIALFTYYAVLIFGVFVVAWFRTWRVLNVLSFAFTFSITALWRGNAYHQNDWLSADLFLLLFFVMFVGISILNALRQEPNLKGYVSGSLVFGLPVAAFSLHASFVTAFPYALAYSALGMAVFYCTLALTLQRQRNSNFRLLIEAFAALAVIFGSLAIPLAFNRHVTAAMWSFEGAGMIWLGLRTHRKLPRFFGVLLQVSAGYSYLHALVFHDHSPSVSMTIINGEYLGSLLLCGTAWFSAWLLHNYQRKDAEPALASYESYWSTIALGVGCFWWVMGGVHEIDAHMHTARIAAVLVHASIGAAILWYTSSRWPWRVASTIAMLAPTAAALIGLSWLQASLHAWHPFQDWGLIGWPVLFATQYCLLWFSDKREEQISQLLIHVLHTGAYLALTAILTCEAQWQCAWRIDGVWPTLMTGLIPALMLWPLTSANNAAKWPISIHNTGYRIHAGITLTAFVLLWLLIVNLSNAGDPVAIPYVPLLNPLDITSLLLFGVAIKWWQSLSEEEQTTWWPFAFHPMILMAGLLFVWMNAALIRTLHYYFNAPLDYDGMFDSVLIQATLSIFWMLLSFALMLYASRRSMRALWITGAILIAVVVAKLLFIDLVHTGTLARIISFLSVGALLFVVSYISPFPPASSQEAIE